jgi:hypothetical protein
VIIALFAFFVTPELYSNPFHSTNDYIIFAQCVVVGYLFTDIFVLFGLGYDFFTLFCNLLHHVLGILSLSHIAVNYFV